MSTNESQIGRKTIRGVVRQWVAMDNAFTIEVPDDMSPDEVASALQTGAGEIRAADGDLHVAYWDGFQWETEEYGAVIDVTIDSVGEDA
jgi:hypothetical protein